MAADQDCLKIGCTSSEVDCRESVDTDPESACNEDCCPRKGIVSLCALRHDRSAISRTLYYPWLILARRTVG
jgi:hypothetical protein